MGNSEARRQKQLAKKKAKRNEKRAIIARATSSDPTIRLAGASTWPILEALVAASIWQHGIGTVVVARQSPNGGVAVGFFLCDVWCLGVKNCYWKLMSSFEYQDFLAKVRKHEPLTIRTPEYVAKLIESSVEYARLQGFAPHGDYRHVRLLLAGIDPTICPETFTFGKDGTPLYVRGPRESMSQAQSIARRVASAGGHFMIPTGPPPELDDNSDGGMPLIMEEMP